MPESLIEPFLERAAGDPDGVAMVFVAEDGTERTMTARDVHAVMAAWAGRLAVAGVGRGDTVLIVLRHTVDLVGAFWGALYAGGVPCIFPYLTEKLDPAVYRAQVSALVRPSGARAVVTSAAFRADLEPLVPAACRVLAAD
ncbi:MAG: AMP-binding protein, partial [Candidatus Binatia bacterium]